MKSCTDVKNGGKFEFKVYFGHHVGFVYVLQYCL